MPMPLQRHRLFLSSIAVTCFVACNAGRGDEGVYEGGGGGGGGGEPQVQRDILRIDSVGSSVAGECSTATGDELDLLFNIVDVEDRIVAPGSNVNNRRLRLGTSFSTEHITVTGARLFLAPDVPCGSDDDCAGLGDGFTCEGLNDASPSSVDVCGVDATLELVEGGLAYVPEGDVAETKSVMLVMANGATIAGDDPVSELRLPSMSSDPDDLRIAGAIDFLGGLSDLYPAEDSTACVSWFTGVGSDSVNLIPETDDCLQPLADVASETQVAALLQTTLAEEGTAGGARANWSALRVAIRHISQRVSASFDRHIVFFTDGPDTGSVPPASEEAALELAVINGVTVHVIQLDNPPEGEPDIGPIDSLSTLACETGGTFLYAREPAGVQRHFRNLRHALANRYALRSRVPAIDDLPPGDYRLAADVTMDVNDDVRTMRLIGDAGDLLNAPIDTRVVLTRR